MEAALATVIVGVGVLASAQLFTTCAQQNIHGAHATVALMLANNVQETMSALSFKDLQTPSSSFGADAGETITTYDDLDDFNGAAVTSGGSITINPPIDARRQSIASMSQYSQVVTVRPIYPNQLSSNNNDSSPSITNNTYTGAVRVRVRVMYQRTPTTPAEEVYQRSWVRLDR